MENSVKDVCNGDGGFSKRKESKKSRDVNKSVGDVVNSPSPSSSKQKAEVSANTNKQRSSTLIIADSIINRLSSYQLTKKANSKIMV